MPYLGKGHNAYGSSGLSLEARALPLWVERWGGSPLGIQIESKHLFAGLTKKNDIGHQHHETSRACGVSDAINNSSKGGIVLDLFGGSGSTMIAAEKQGRISRLMELDPKYCDVIVKRWEDFTGKKAELLTI
jgi:hypothetical protein